MKCSSARGWVASNRRKIEGQFVQTVCSDFFSQSLLPGLVPSIHVFELATISKLKAWMAGLPGGQLLRFEQGAGDHCRILDFPYPTGRAGCRMMPTCPGAIANLSVALFREWRPERLFVIFTAYLDESGTHGGSPITLMSAFLGSARQWQNFEKDYVKLRRIYGFSVFHAKDWRDTDGEFEGWSR
jgi:hypothetical protein